MKKFNVLIIVFLFSIHMFSNNDSIVKHKFFITTIPSNLLVGDVSLGVEHLFKKRFSHEFQAYLKCFTPVILQFDKGFRLNYQLKYNVIHRKFFRMSINVTTSYKEASFNNKKSYWSENNENYGDIKPKYKMDREIIQFGIGGGIGLIFKVTKRIYIGNELLLEICKENKVYTVKERELPLNSGYVPLSEPYYYNSNTFSGFQKYNPIFNFKVSYRL